jgi:hypothetical protein
MPKIIAGTKALREAKKQTQDHRTVKIHKATGGNVSKIRCTCGTLAHPTPNAQGGTTLKCANCGRQFGVRSL